MPELTHHRSTAVTVPILREAIAFIRGAGPLCPPDAGRLILKDQYDPSSSDDCRLRLHARLRSAADIADVEMVDNILSGRPYKSVAAAAGLSLRHFFRRRDALLERMAAGLSHDVSLADVKERTDEAHARLYLASRLIARGFPQRAAANLNELLETGLARGLRPVALLTRARARFDCGDHQASQADVRGALACDGSPAEAVRSEALFAESFFNYRNGHYATSIQLAEHGAELHGRAPLGHSYDLRRRVSNLHFLAVQHQEGGSAQRAIELFLQARALLYSVGKPPLRELAENLALCAISRVSEPGQLSTAWREANEAATLAQWHGLDREEVWAYIAMAVVANSAGRHTESSAAARTALAVARECLGGDELCRILNANSRIETNANNVERAVKLLPEIRGLRPSLAAFMSGITLLCEARVHEAANDAPAALRAATEAIKTLEKVSKSHYIGLAYTTRAATVGSSKAVADLDAAIEYLRNGGSTFDLARALELSATLTGNSRHATEARELRATAVL